MFSRIESTDFAVHAGLASGASTFVEAISQDPAFIQLSEEARQNPYVPDAICQRIQFLTDYKIDYRYENPHDTALATYAWLLYENAPKIAKVAAVLLTEARQVWWARHVANHILSSDEQLKRVHQTRMDRSDFFVGDTVGYYAPQKIMESAQTELLVGLFVERGNFEIMAESSFHVHLTGDGAFDVSWGEIEGLQPIIDSRPRSRMARALVKW